MKDAFLAILLRLLAAVPGLLIFFAGFYARFILNQNDVWLMGTGALIAFIGMISVSFHSSDGNTTVS